MAGSTVGPPCELLPSGECGKILFTVFHESPIDDEVGETGQPILETESVDDRVSGNVD